MKQIIVVPHWVRDALHRNDLRLEDVLDFDKLRTVVSTSDLAGFLTLQSKLNAVVGTDDITTYFALYEAWRKSASPDNLKFLENSVRALEGTPEIVDELVTRLLNDDGRMRERYEKPFNSYDITPAVGAIVIYPGYFGQVNVELQLQVVRAVLRLLHMYQKQHDVYSTSWQRQYIALLSGKQISV